MGGGSSRESVKKTIETEIQTEIVNETTNINKILAVTITDTTMSVTTNVANNIRQSVGAANVFAAGALTADGGLIDINQAISMEIIQEAVMKISTDTKSQSELANKLSQDIANKTKNDSAMKASLQAAADLTAVNKDAGGVEKLVADTMAMISSMANTIGGGEISSEQETTIRNTMRASIKNVTINQNDITNRIENIITTNIVTNTTSTCESNLGGNNQIIVQDGITAKNGGIISIKQSARVEALVKCIIDTANTAELSSAIINEGALGVTSDNSNTNKSDTDAETKATVTEENIQESGLTSFMNNLTPGGILSQGGLPILLCCTACCCLIIFLIIGVIFMSSSKSKPPVDSDMSDMS